MHPAERLVERARTQAGLDELGDARLDFLGQDDGTVVADVGLLGVAEAIDRSEAFGREVGGEFEHGVERVA